MKTTGIVRPVDGLGRIVLPIEIRRNLDIEERDLLELYLEGERIILQKAELACVFCGNKRGLADFKEKCLCRDCITKIGQI